LYPASLIDYINQEPSLRPFYTYHPSEKSHWEKVIQAKTLSAENRKVLVDSLLSQYQNEPNEAVTLGDIVISPTVAAQQAATAGHSTDHEIFILAAHGLLHILGYDHANAADEKVMFALQEDLVKKHQASA
jgi:rRNA maturation RNase YbeY